ncbi:hypothetical protein JVU11DRAFT_11016 [Chiua virens]|nr:hypothetical protein JVU11DRAFT_11016 [Chiua virens]
MCDTSDVPCDSFIVPEYDDPSPESLSRPGTPLPDDSRTLRRTASYASIKTVHPRVNQGIRRRIAEIAKVLQQKSAKKQKEDFSTQGIPETDVRDAKHVSTSKAPKYKRKVKTSLQISLRQSEEGSVAIHDTLYSGIPSARDVPSTALLCKSDSLFGEVTLEDGGFPISCGPHVITESEDVPLILKAGFEDVELEIRPSESDITIWDGLQASQHVFKCRLYLRCRTHPFNAVVMPDVRRIEMTCTTHPTGSRYAQPPVLLATYAGRACGINKDGSLHMDLETGIEIDLCWRTVLDEDDDTWGWYKEVSVPLSPRLFDKMEYREFKLVGQAWMGGDCVESELTFGISMLLRGVDMM